MSLLWLRIKAITSGAISTCQEFPGTDFYPAQNHYSHLSPHPHVPAAALCWFRFLLQLLVLTCFMATSSFSTLNIHPQTLLLLLILPGNLSFLFWALCCGVSSLMSNPSQLPRVSDYDPPSYPVFQTVEGQNSDPTRQRCLHSNSWDL